MDRWGEWLVGLLDSWDDPLRWLLGTVPFFAAWWRRLQRGPRSSRLQPRFMTFVRRTGEQAKASVVLQVKTVEWAATEAGYKSVIKAQDSTIKAQQKTIESLLKATLPSDGSPGSDSGSPGKTPTTGESDTEKRYGSYANLPEIS